MNLVVAADGSKAARHALKRRIGLSRQLATGSNSVTLISVHDDAAYRHAETSSARRSPPTACARRARRRSKASRKLLDAAGIPHDMEVRTGGVSMELLDSAASAAREIAAMPASGQVVVEPAEPGHAQRHPAISAASLRIIAGA